MNNASRPFLIALGAFALLGVIFSGFSTFDFVAHLDRQTHEITCSVLPGLGAKDASGTSGCSAALMSPYSSVLRSWTWGGIPISLPSLAVFAFLLFRALDLWLRKEVDASEARFLIWATLLPVLVSVVYFLISVIKVGAVCKVCVGIYVSSIGAFAAALLANRKAGGGAVGQGPAIETKSPWGRYLLYFAEGCALVLIPVVLYLALKPAYAGPAGGCGTLMHPEDKYGVRLKLSGTGGGAPAVEILDPLCPSCRGFRQRLAASGLEEKLALETVLFPLDKECNWMVNDSVHPGSCAVSEAILCGGEDASEILAYAFKHQEELRELGGQGNDRVYSRLKRQFPQLGSCLGLPATKAKLNRSLRWVVGNSLSVLTPQLFVRDQKVCDEDTDLGLEYVLPRMLSRGGRGAARR